MIDETIDVTTPDTPAAIKLGEALRAEALDAAWSRSNHIRQSVAVYERGSDDVLAVLTVHYLIADEDAEAPEGWERVATVSAF